MFPMHRKVKLASEPAGAAAHRQERQRGCLAWASRRPIPSIDSDEKLIERVRHFIHERIGTTAIAEQYIEGREDSRRHRQQRAAPGGAGCGNRASTTRNGRRRLAHRHREGQARHRLSTNAAGIEANGPAKDLPPELVRSVSRTWPKQIYCTLELDGYARIDFRLAADGTPIFPGGPIPIRKSPKARNSPTPPSIPASAIPTCCSVSWRLPCVVPGRPGAAAA